VASSLGALRYDDIAASVFKPACLRLVAEDIIFAPVAFTRSRSASSGRPKWKLTISGVNSSTSSQSSLSNGVRFDVGTGAFESMPILVIGRIVRVAGTG
jgi:hypothetical protein